MAKAKTHTLNGRMPDDAKPMIREVKRLCRTSRKEIGIYMVIKFALSSKKNKMAFERYAGKNRKAIDKAMDLLDEHEKGKSKGST